MPFKPGHKKIGGRQKGTKNKDSIPLSEKAEELGIDPFRVLLMFAAGKWEELGYDKEKQITGQNEYGIVEKYTIDPSVRAKAAQEACNYLYPKLKAIEHSQTDDPSKQFKIVIEDYRTK
jgi:hypothetical protein